MTTQTGPKMPVRKKGSKKDRKIQRIWIAGYLFGAFIFISVYLLLKLDVFEIFGDYQIIAQKFSLGGFFSVLILAFAKWLEMAIVKHAENKVDRYNLIRLIRLLS